MMPPDNEHQYNRRRAEDVFRVVESEVFPRLGAIDTKMSLLDKSVNRLTVEGCAHRAGDLQRTQSIEGSVSKIFYKIDAFGEDLTAARLDLVAKVGDIKLGTEKQYAGLKAWIQAGVIVILLGVAIYLAKDYLHDLEVSAGKQPPATISSPK